MKIKIRKQLRHYLLMKLLLLAGLFAIISCKDEYLYDNSEPEWLGASIYDYLKANENYTYYTKLIDDLQESDKYRDVLAKTGSKTLFVADDDAFERFFQNNPWNVSSYEGLSLTQKRLIIKFSMIDNAYLIETLSNYYNGELQEGSALRRSTSVSVLDSIPHLSGDKLPDGPFWNSHKNKGMYLLKDATSWPMVHFLEGSLKSARIDNADFSLITGVERSPNDAHIFSVKVKERDITCKNGYIHVLEDVLLPPVNLAEYLDQNPDSRIFSDLLDRFSAPYYNASQTNAYNQVNPEQPIDSIFEKIYYSAWDGRVRYPDGRLIGSDLLLPFNPGRNEYVSSAAGSSMQSDMAAIIAPTNEAMTDYFENGAGVILKNRFGSWEDTPDYIIMKLLNRHLRESFLESVPGRFDKLVDNNNSPIPISPGDISSSYVGLNGVVYNTNKVYPPDDYISVYAPVLLSEDTKVFNWAVNENEFDLYLNALKSTYTFFVPTDEYFENYLDPIAYAKDVKGVMKYWYNEETSEVNATVYTYDPLTGEVGDSVNTIDNYNFIRNRLLDMLDTHIVIGDVESGAKYYFTKNGNILLVNGTGADLKVQAGFDIESGTSINVVEDGVYRQENGTTFFIDKPLQAPLQSVYGVLSKTPEFSEFFNLLNGFPATSAIFLRQTNYYGLDFNVSLFNTFNYTVYVPTNEAILQAINDGLIMNWEQIDAIQDSGEKAAEIEKLERFLRYHFQDNSIFVDGETFYKLYQTATIKNDDAVTQFGTYKDKYYRLGINSDGQNITLNTENYGTANLIREDGLYNIMTRDYIFSNSPQSYREIDGTGTGSNFENSTIITSSTAVIHQIDNVLRFE
ncbi:fasciclin domain-containing protein [Maribellus sediminis]|uniref:fasciclin domain-containing protein n=1 Tax=Maribellus sediminis TaxID=2696285 RepID=UPI00142F821F|nr:fasciclin domain-containing protein [Maribellus sediminis]